MILVLSPGSVTCYLMMMGEVLTPFLFLFIWDRVSCGPGWLLIPYIAKYDLESLISLSSPPKYGDYSLRAPHETKQLTSEPQFSHV